MIFDIFDDNRTFDTDAQGRPYTYCRRVALQFWGDWTVIIPTPIRYAIWNWMVGYPKGAGIKWRAKKVS
jgi:hypothetical protein